MILSAYDSVGLLRLHGESSAKSRISTYMMQQVMLRMGMAAAHWGHISEDLSFSRRLL
jgi:hypothetical protein